MRKVLNSVKENKKIIIVVVLIIVLVGTIYFMNRGSANDAASTVASTQKTATENKLTSILSSIEGVGNTNVMITEKDENITGVVIVCDGGNSIVVKNDILNAVSTALNIDKKIIAIYAMNK